METITVKEAAAILGVTAFTVRVYIKKKMLNAERKPKGLQFEYLLSRSEVESLKASSTK